MGLFEDRERAEEKAYVLRSEREFAVRSRGLRLISEWAAPLLELDEEAYFRQLLDVELALGDPGVLEKITADIRSAGREESMHAIAQNIAAARTDAGRQLDENVDAAGAA